LLISNSLSIKDEYSNEKNQRFLSFLFGKNEALDHQIEEFQDKVKNSEGNSRA